jgi:large subunit ribosomal protein L1
VQSANAAKYKRKDANNQALANKKKKKTSTSYATPDLRDALQFSLVDAMRYVKNPAHASLQPQNI